MNPRYMALIGAAAMLPVLAFAGFSDAPTADRIYPEELVRTPAGDTPFEEFYPGVSVYPLYGTFDGDGPHAVIVRNDPLMSVEAEHNHTSGHWAVVIAGRLQHWESHELDEGPILTSGASWFQPGGVSYFDRCLGPEVCVTLVSWLEPGDFQPVQ